MIPYRIVSKKNPQDLTAPGKYYLCPVSSGSLDIDALAELISDGSTLREADVYAVLVALLKVMTQQLAQGKRIKLGHLGTFAIGILSKGANTKSEAGTQLIKRCKINYYPGSKLKHFLKTLSFKRIN